MIAIGGEIVELIEFVSFLLWFSYGFAMVSFLVLRKVKKDAPRPYKVSKSNKMFLITIQIDYDTSKSIFGRFVYSLCYYLATTNTL